MNYATKRWLFGVAAIAGLLTTSTCRAQTPQNGVLKIGGFRCIDLKPLCNDKSYDLYEVGNFTSAAFRMDVWKRHGVPYWYSRQTGDIRVAGAQWSPSRTSTNGSNPSEVLIPLHGIAAQEIFFLGNVGDGFETAPDVETPAGEYVLRYVDGREETVPLVAGKNVAHYRYGHFVPQAEFAFGFKDAQAQSPEVPGTLNYHLDEMLPVNARRQLMTFQHTPQFAGVGLESVKFRCTNPKGSLVLAGLTLHESGPRMNALVYNGRTVRVYPADTPPAKPSPLDAMVDKDRLISLDGDWQFATDPGNLGVRRAWYSPSFDVKGWVKMPVPSQWYVQGVDYHGVAWYRKTFDVPQSFPGSVLELCFGGVDYDARVWVNGEYVGRHVGAFSSFKLDATKAIKKGARNLIVVRVDSPIDPGYSPQKTIVKGNSQDDIAMPFNEEGCSGGIFRSVTLAGRGDVGVEDVWATSVVQTDLKHVDATIHLELSPAPSANSNVTVSCRLSEPEVRGRKAKVYSAEKTLSLSGVTPVKFDFGIDDPLLWYPWEQGPQHLHTLEIEVRRGGELLDKHVSRIGLRQVEMNRDEKCVYVNHHRIFIKGMLNDDPHWMSLMDRTGYRQRIQLQVDANLNLIRMVGHQSSSDMYDLCDEMGMMIWQEMPLQWGYSSAKPIRDDILKVVSETVRQCRPYASVVGWSAWNEGGQKGFTEQITQTITNLDNTRPISHASGYGDFDIHIYPNITPSKLSRRTFFWTGLKLGFVSEVGAYGLSSLDEMKEIMGDNLFPFDSADYYWETFNNYRYWDGPVFYDAPTSGNWPTEKIREYVQEKIGSSEWRLCQFMKFMYENLRAQRFNPTTAAIHCRFDDPMPSAFLGVVNFNGRPRKAYYAVQQSCQPVLPILFFDFQGAEDVRVVNEYWNRSWQGCTLQFQITDRSGKVISQLERPFDLPADATMSVLKREEIGDIFHIPGGFLAQLTVLDKGKVLSTNTYDLTADEIEAFVTSVYPVPPVTPINSVVVTAAQLAAANATNETVTATDTYSPRLLKLEAMQKLRFNVDLPQDGAYLIRVACSSGVNLRRYALLIDGKKADLENYPFTDMRLGTTRSGYSTQRLNWCPGWSAKLTKGTHQLELTWPGQPPAAAVLLDAISLQHCSNPNTTGYQPDAHAAPGTADNKDLK